MKIPLPKDYTFKEYYSYEMDGYLHIRRLKNFNELMYNITYKTLNKLECRYCGAKLTYKPATLDHIYPVSLGGPYLPCNLSPCCSKCNFLKGSMLEDDFRFFLELSDDAQRDYKANYIEKEKQLIREAPIIPKEWFSYESVDKIIVSKKPNKDNKKLAHSKHMFKQYNRIINPFIVDKNYNLLTSYFDYVVAKENKVDKVPVIVLENVIYKEK